MKKLLLEIKQFVDEHNGKLPPDRSSQYRNRYRTIIENSQIECPPPDESKRKKGARGRMKRTKARNLLARLTNYELEVLRFMDDSQVPFTNNQGENDIRMTKVQQKISGCFRSMDGANIFCRVRSFLSTCRKNQLHPSEALRRVFEGDFSSHAFEMMVGSYSSAE